MDSEIAYDNAMNNCLYYDVNSYQNLLGTDSFFVKRNFIQIWKIYTLSQGILVLIIVETRLVVDWHYLTNLVLNLLSLMYLFLCTILLKFCVRKLL